MQLELVAHLPWPPPDDVAPLGVAVLERLAAADAQGFAAAWIGDAAAAMSGARAAAIETTPSLHLACAWLAARTTRLRVGVRASLPATLHPIRLAEEIATLDGLSGGRLLWAAGPGPLHPEGADAASRVFAEQVEIVEKAWTGEPFSHAGLFFQIPELQCLPTPVQRPGPPLLIAPPLGSASATRAWADRQARPLWLEGSAQPAGAGRGGGHGLEAGQRASRVVCRIYVGETSAQARATARAAGLEAPPAGEAADAGSGWTVVGDASACTTGLQALAERTGLDAVVCRLDVGRLPPEEIAACQRRLAERVLPRIA